jgi:carbonic anhydrase/acetyltransferase-like protein (isoleucine patch superfamily)
MSRYEFEGKRPRVHDQAFVHPEAVLIGDVTVEAGCYVGAGAALRGDIGSIKIGSGSNVQENCVVHTFPDKATVIHSQVHIGHGCILHGCEILSHVLIGMGSIIADGVVINSDCLIGAGSFVPFQEVIPPNSVAVGIPAKVIKKIEADQRERITNGLSIYQKLTKRYLKSFRKMHVEDRLRLAP